MYAAREMNTCLGTQKHRYRCLSVNAEQMDGREAVSHAGAGRAYFNKPAIVRQKFLGTDAANSALVLGFWGLLGDDCVAYGLMYYYYITLQASKVCQES